MENMDLNDKFVITIGREYGTGGHSIGRKVAKTLGIPFYDENIETLTAEKFGLDEESVRKLGEYQGKNPFIAGADNIFNYRNMDDQIFMKQSEMLWLIAGKGSCVIVGRCADYVLRNHPGIYSFFLYSGIKRRVDYITKENKRYPELSKTPKEDVRKIDRMRAASYHYYTGQVWGDRNNYHMSIDSCILGSQTSKIIVDFVKKAEEIRRR